MFPSEQSFIRRSEDLFEQPEQLWAELFAFLQLPVMPLPVQGRKAHVGACGDSSFCCIADDDSDGYGSSRADAAIFRALVLSCCLGGVWSLARAGVVPGQQNPVLVIDCHAICLRCVIFC